MPHTTKIKIRGYHLDLYGHVNNARYLEFLEEGRWSWLEARGDLADFVSCGWGFSVVNVNINYRRAARMGDTLEIHTSLTRLGKRSGVVHQDVCLDGADTRVADADVTFVVVSLETGQSVNMDGTLRDVLDGLLEDSTPAAAGPSTEE